MVLVDMQSYTNYRVEFKSLGAGQSADSITLASEPVSNLRGKVYREFFGAIACAVSTNSADAVLSLFYYDTVGKVMVLMDRVTLSPGESAVWTHEDYGIKLEPGGYMQFVVADASVAVLIKTRDKVARA